LGTLAAVGRPSKFNEETLLDAALQGTGDGAAQSDGAWWVEDLDSTNGTYVGGQRISTPRQIAPGIPVVIGRTTMELR